MSRPIDSIPLSPAAGNLSSSPGSATYSGIGQATGQGTSPDRIFTVGEIVEGKVTGFQNGLVTGVFKGVTLLAETLVPMRIGQSILVEVLESRPGRVHLKVLDPSVASGFGSSPRDSQAVMLKAMGLSVTGQSREALSAVMGAGVALSAEAVDFVTRAAELFQTEGSRAATLLFTLGLPASSATMALATGALTDPAALSLLLAGAMDKFLKLGQESKDPRARAAASAAVAAMSGRNLGWADLAGKFKNLALPLLFEKSDQTRDVRLIDALRQTFFSLDALSLATKSSMTDYFLGFPFLEEGRARHFLMIVKGSGGAIKKIDPRNTSVLLDFELSAVGRVKAGLYISNGVVSIRFITENEEVASALREDSTDLAAGFRENTRYEPGPVTVRASGMNVPDTSSMDKGSLPSGPGQSADEKGGNKTMEKRQSSIPGVQPKVDVEA